MQCPNCNSDQVQTFRMTYENGTTTRTGYMVGAGATRNNGQTGLGGGAATMQGLSMTLTAQRVAPPREQSVSGLFWIISVIFLPLLVIAFIRQIKAAKWNKTEYPKLMAQWEKSWLCHKCGHTFTL
jgi:hypothetical protein